MAQVTLQDDNPYLPGEHDPQAPWPGGPQTPSGLGTPSGDGDGFVSGLAREYGIGAGETDVANYNAKNPEDRAQYESDLRRQYAQRAGSNGGGSRGGGGGNQGLGGLFDDPASNQLQSIAQAQMGEVRHNPRLDSLMAFLDKEFSRLSTSPGFSTEERSLLHTQALEPIEQRRQASNTRALERAGARGFLPTSGLTYLTGGPSGGVESLDTSYDRMRGTADRDLALADVNQRRADLSQALQIGQLGGLDIPRSQRTEELALARVPYQMGRDALSDLLAVLGSSPTSSDLFNQSNQTSQRSYQQQLDDERRQSDMMEQIGGLLAGLFT